MTGWDIALLLLLAVAVGFALRRVLVNRKRGGCSCGCSGCSGSCSSCSSPCARRDETAPRRSDPEKPPR